MMTGSYLSFKTIDEAQLAKVQGTVNLLEHHLVAEERDATAEGYRLAWYQRLQTKAYRREDIDQFRRFVDEMCERALKRANRTQALFPTPSAGQMADEGTEIDVLRARQLCESFCASLDGSIEGKS